MKKYDTFKKEAKTRAENRERTKRGLNADARDMLATKAMLSVLSNIVRNMGDDFLKSEKEALARAENAELFEAVQSLMKEIEQQRAVGKELDNKFLDRPEIQEAVKKISPENFDENMQDLRNGINNQGKELNVDMLLRRQDKEQTQKNTQSNAQKHTHTMR
ncbi:TPA: hypothetical protein RPW15_001873 [Campylobacter fetus subsp. venerealis]|nr:hypothetical protein [Campylobacter fetus subsp. venerealis]HDX6253946.1 hypothetical protein [Campylobacter fetus subsp. venerealis]HDX6258134.1 hypothetical protein [Campylobacter fetus subsp. venerealis]HDX6262260.1 hypothetical protein [Campylobacter fetus subsp. venerealis]HDX6263923.1 hypothetical protein [Campylobacter fetus subsp. venerealis]